MAAQTPSKHFTSARLWTQLKYKKEKTKDHTSCVIDFSSCLQEEHKVPTITGPQRGDQGAGSLKNKIRLLFFAFTGVFYLSADKSTINFALTMNYVMHSVTASAH